MEFKDLNIIEPILKALKIKEYNIPTLVQEKSIPVLLNNQDILGSAQTGTGKTAAYAIPILQKIYLEKLEQNETKKTIKALVLAPTRELALQIYDNFVEYSKYINVNSTVVYGGIKQARQVRDLQRGVDILVATPGRLLDLIQQRKLSLSDVNYLVLDEADRMLDMGFIRDVKKIVAKVPKKRQTMLFSATLPKSIVNLADSILTTPERVSITPVETTLDTIQQTVFYVSQKNKFKLLLNILKKNDHKSVLVFTRTKRNANTVSRMLQERNVSAAPIHGNKSQAARTAALKEFKAGNVRVLVATDLAARGLDIDDLSLVVNYNLPDVAETYIHRIGRTGRANKNGLSMSFCNEEEVPLLQAIQKHISMYIPVDDTHPFHSIFDENADYSKKKPKGRKPNSNKLTVKYTKRVVVKTKPQKNDSTAITDKIKNSQAKKKKEPLTGIEKKKGWAKAKPKSRSYGPRDSNNSFSKNRNTSKTKKNYSTKKH